jgi:hypothetical protein
LFSILSVHSMVLKNERGETTTTTTKSKQHAFVAKSLLPLTLPITTTNTTPTPWWCKIIKHYSFATWLCGLWRCSSIIIVIIT